ncbi:MAG: hypothetical protein MJZ20_03615 [Bacteroidaceae bacterium]|nr:hypothetical protein [Bacteroidaceae bacterium]
MKTSKESMLCTEIKNQIEPFIASADGCAYNEEEVEKAILLAFEKGKKETEEQAWEYYRKKCESKDEPQSIKELFERTCFIKQSEELNEIKKQWHDCFLSCSSPYCAAHFPAVEMQGELGNMSKREPEG